jgi:hypothetical protein
MAALFLAVIVKRVPLPGEPTGVTKGRPAASDISPGGQSMASLDDRRPSHDIVQDDIVGTLTVDVCRLPYFTVDRLLVTRVHRITAAHSCRSQIVGSAAGTGADDPRPHVESIFAQVFR